MSWLDDHHLPSSLRTAFASLLLFASPLSAAGTQEVTVPAGMIELAVEATEGSDIQWEARAPLTLGFKVYEGGTIFVTHSSYAIGGQLVVVSDSIDWEARKRDKTTWIVRVQGIVPTPPPDPNIPPVPPDPNVPLPNTVPDYYGVGAIAYREALRVNKPAEAAAISEQFRTQYMALHQGQILPAQAAAAINKYVQTLPQYWHPWIQSVSQALAAARVKHGSGITLQRDMFREVADALNIAAKVAPTRLAPKPASYSTHPMMWAIAP